MQITVVKCTESTKGGFVVTVSTGKSRTVTQFGKEVVKKLAGERYIMKHDEAVAIDSTHELDLSQFEQVVKTFTGEDKMRSPLRGCSRVSVEKSTPSFILPVTY